MDDHELLSSRRNIVQESLNALRASLTLFHLTFALTANTSFESIYDLAKSPAPPSELQLYHFTKQGSHQVIDQIEICA